MSTMINPATPLTAENVGQIDRAARGVLARTGIRICHPKFFAKLQKAGAQVAADPERVYFPSDWLDAQLARAPARFTLYSRDGTNDLPMGAGRVHFSNGGRVFRILDMATGGYRLTRLRDVVHTAALVNRLDYIQLYIISCQAHDVAPDYYHLNDFYHALNHTTKHVMGGCDTWKGAEQMWRLASMIAGGEDLLAQKPFVSVITNPISPLTVDGEVLEILAFCAARGIPVTCAPAPISGASAPATLAGTLVQMHAEALAGVALTQVLAPGAKVFYGAVPAPMDLRTMEYAMGSVEMALMNAAAVQLARHYRLPIYASAGVTESKRPEVQAGCEKSLSNLLVAANGADLVHLAAGMLDSGNSISYAQFVIDNEIIGMIRRILGGITVNENTLAAELIERVGPGGNYVIEDHTIDHMFSEFFYPELGIRSNFDVWESRGRPDMLSCANEKAEAIIRSSSEGLLDEALIEKIKKTFPHLQPV